MITALLDILGRRLFLSRSAPSGSSPGPACPGVVFPGAFLLAVSRSSPTSGPPSPFASPSGLLIRRHPCGVLRESLLLAKHDLTRKRRRMLLPSQVDVGRASGLRIREPVHAGSVDESLGWRRWHHPQLELPTEDRRSQANEPGY